MYLFSVPGVSPSALADSAPWEISYGAIFVMRSAAVCVKTLKPRAPPPHPPADPHKTHSGQMQRKITTQEDEDKDKEQWDTRAKFRGKAGAGSQLCLKWIRFHLKYCQCCLRCMEV